MRGIGVWVWALVLLAPAAAIARPGSPALVEWVFDRPGDLQGWQANADLADVRVADGSLQFRGAGADPILACSTVLAVPATPWQAIEVRLKADRDGECVIFWGNTTDPPYGGLRPDQNTAFRVRGDGIWRTYRVFPFWQRMGRLVRLRFDPYDGARFSIAHIRVVELGSPPVRGASFIASKAPAGTYPGDGLMPTADGGVWSPRMANGDGFVVLTSPDADTAARNIVAVSLRTRVARRAAIVYATTDSWGLHSLTFPVVPDGRFHTYNVDMLNSPDWRGRAVALGLRPGDKAGDSCDIRSLELSDRAVGPADLRVMSFAAEDALPRVGRPVIIGARVTNAGGLRTGAVKAELRLPLGARLVRAITASAPPLVFGEEAELRWQVVFRRPGPAVLSLAVRQGTGPAVDARSVAYPTPMPRIGSARRLPRVAPVRGKLDVGVYYFPGWKSAGQWSPISRFPERKPVLGWYREGSPQVADWQLRWAAEHGITFFAYDWYWSQGARQLEHALHDGYMHSPYRRAVKYCLLWANHNPDNTSSVQDSRAVARYWIQHYFRQPEYYRIDGRPVVIIFSTYRYRADLGSDGVRAAFEAMREECRNAGVPPVYLIACVGGDTSEPKVAQRETYDAITAYNWPGLGVRGSQAWAPYRDLVPAYRRQWEALAQTSPLPIMTPISGGWDSRPWHGDAALVRSGRTPALFEKHLKDALGFVRANPGKALPAVLIEAWNEFGEGSYIEPQSEFGFGYLDAIRDVFSAAPRAHVDLAPADAGATVPQVAMASPGATRWAFAAGPQGWETGMNITSPAAVGGALTARTTGDDPAFFSPPLQIQAAGFRALRVRMLVGAPTVGAFEDSAQLFWSTRTTGTSEAASVRVPIRADGRWHTYEFDLSTNPRWRGIVTSLRLDPCSRQGITVRLATVALER